MHRRFKMTKLNVQSHLLELKVIFLPLTKFSGLNSLSLSIHGISKTMNWCNFHFWVGQEGQTLWIQDCPGSFGTHCMWMGNLTLNMWYIASSVFQWKLAWGYGVQTTVNIYFCRCFFYRFFTRGKTNSLHTWLPKLLMLSIHTIPMHTCTSKW